MKKHKLKIFILFSMAALSMLFSNALVAEEIGKISIDQQGSYKFANDMLLFNLQEKVGQEFNEKVLNQDIKRLYATGFFSDVVAETSKMPDGKMHIIIKVLPKPKIKNIIFKGNKKFPSIDLTKQINIVSDVPLNDKKLKESAKKLREFYQSKGYNDAKIIPIVKKAGKGYVNVIFDITENLRLKINNVTFVGNTVYSSWTLKNAIANQHSYFSWLFEVGLLNRGELQNDKIRLRELYWNEGYLDFKVEKIEIKEDPGDPEYVDLTFYLHEGKPYKVGKIYITGSKHFKEQTLMQSLRLRPGDIYDNRTERKDIDDIDDRYYTLGYADFFCRAIRIPDYKTHTVDIEYKIREGIIYTIHDINISGNKITKDKVIRRELAIQPGDPVDKNRIAASKSRLMGMGYFEEVKAVTVNSGEPAKKNVNFEVKEKNTAHFKIGGGFSDTESLVGMVELQQTNFDLFSPENYFQGGGQRLRLQGFFGLERMDFNANFTEPWLFDMPLKLDVAGYGNQVKYEYWSERRIGTKISLAKRVFDDFTTITGAYKFEVVRVLKMDDWLTPEFTDQEGSQRVGALSLAINRDTRDSLTEPTTGYQLNFLSEFTTQGLGASNDYVRLEAKASHYFNWKFWEERMLVFHIGAKVGTVSEFKRGGDVPIFERYFLGGGDSLRGFPYRNVSPTANVAGDEIAIGGQSMLLLTAEVTHPIWEFIRGAVFCDVGGVNRSSFSFAADQLNMGVGYGLRIKVPYVNAPVKIDLAYPVVNNVDGLDKKFRVHFNMGFTW